MSKGIGNPFKPNIQRSRSPYAFGSYAKQADALQAERQRLKAWRRKSGQSRHTLWLEILLLLAVAVGLYLIASFA
ncbi:MAG: hypothetical protein WCD20_07085 [Rhodomicrobium sp.]